MGGADRPESAPILRARVLVTGRVQAVFFRAATAGAATPLGLRGWVRNRADGRVEALFQGQADAVERMIEWCRQGPPAARVEGVAVEWQEPLADEAPFHIR